jgi:hypothetical protein
MEESPMHLLFSVGAETRAPFEFVRIRRCTLLIVCLHLVIALPVVGGGDAGWADSPDEKKNASPRALMEEFFAALSKGNPKGVVSAFDVTTEEGKIASEINGKLAEAMGSILNLKRKAKEKFGAKGANILGVTSNEKEIHDFVKKEMKIFIGEDGETAVAFVPGFKQPYVQLRRKKDKWFINVTQEEAWLYATVQAAGASEVFHLDEIAEINKILKRSKTVEDFESGVQKVTSTERPAEKANEKLRNLFQTFPRLRDQEKTGK